MHSDRKPLALLLALLLTGGLATARAEICATDDPPAATLLLPYFEVDLARPDGVTTLFSINNASATAVLANVVLWTDLGVPTLSFPVYLTGYDVQTINLRDVLAGQLPQTASVGQDPLNTVSPNPGYPTPWQDVNFASCYGELPPAPLDAAAVADLRAAHRGLSSNTLGGCAALNFADQRARGYVTVDTVNSCSTTVRTPRDSGYFVAGGLGRATDQNVLWGDFFLVDPANNFASGDSLVRVEAAPGGFAPGELTFYGRFLGYSAADDREPLATTWLSRFAIGGGFDGGTDLLVWRDPQAPSETFQCSRGPLQAVDWFPLDQAALLVFDEEEHVEEPAICPVLCPPQPLFVPFPAATTRLTIGSAAMPVPFDFGFLYADLKRGTTITPEQPNRSQAWMTTLMSAVDRYAVGFAAAPLDSACAPRVCNPDEGTCP